MISTQPTISIKVVKITLDQTICSVELRTKLFESWGLKWKNKQKLGIGDSTKLN